MSSTLEIPQVVKAHQNGHHLSIYLCFKYVSHGCFHAMLPVGHVQSRKSMQEVIRFVSEKRLFLLADEVDVFKHCHLTRENQKYEQICVNKHLDFLFVSSTGLSGLCLWGKE